MALRLLKKTSLWHATKRILTFPLIDLIYKSNESNRPNKNKHCPLTAYYKKLPTKNPVHLKMHFFKRYFATAIHLKFVLANCNVEQIVYFYTEFDHIFHLNLPLWSFKKCKLLTVFVAVSLRIFVANFTWICPVLKKIMRYVHTYPANHFQMYIYICMTSRVNARYKTNLNF